MECIYSGLGSYTNLYRVELWRVYLRYKPFHPLKEVTYIRPAPVVDDRKQGID